MSEFHLNKFEKRDLIIRLLNEGKTYREVCHLAHVSPRDIKPIAKEYERKKRLETKKGEQKNQSNQKPAKKLSLSSRAFTLFSDGKTQVQVAVDLNIDFQKVRKYWLEYLRLNKMKKLYNIYIENEYHLDYLLHIYYFMLRNEIPIKDCEDVLRVSHETVKLYQIHSNLTAELERLQKIKNNYSLNQNTNNYKPLLPLGLPKYYYNY